MTVRRHRKGGRGGGTSRGRGGKRENCIATTINDLSTSCLANTGISGVSRLMAEDINLLRTSGVIVDDDNQPVEENIPTAGTERGIASDGADEPLRWGHNGIDPRRQQGHGASKPKFKNMNSYLIPGMPWLAIWLILSPVGFYKTVVIPKMNEHLRLGPLSLRELIVFIGLWHFMACYVGVARRDW